MLKPFISRSLRRGYFDTSKLTVLFKALTQKFEPIINKIRPYTAYILVAFAFFIIGFTLKRFIPVAIVNGHTVNRTEFNDLLLRRAGRVVLQEMVINDIIETEAKKRNIKVTDEEIETQITFVKRDLKEQGASLDLYLAQQAMTMNEFEDQVKIQIIIKKMFEGGIKVTEKEIEDFYVNNNVVKGKAAILRSQRVAINQAITQYELRQAYSQWLTGQLQKAKVTHLIKI